MPHKHKARLALARARLHDANLIVERVKKIEELEKEIFMSKKDSRPTCTKLTSSCTSLNASNASKNNLSTPSIKSGICDAQVIATNAATTDLLAEQAKYAQSMAQLDKEALYTTLTALIIMLFFWGSIYLSHELYTMVFAMPLWFIISCLGSYFLSIILVWCLVKFALKHINLNVLSFTSLRHAFEHIKQEQDNLNPHASTDLNVDGQHPFLINL